MKLDIIIKKITKKREVKSYTKQLRYHATLFKEFKEVGKGTLAYYLAQKTRKLNTIPLQIAAHTVCGEIETYIRDCCFQGGTLEEVKKSCKPAYEEYLACALRLKSNWWDKLVSYESDSEDFKELARVYTYRLVNALSARDFIQPEYRSNFSDLKVCRLFQTNKRKNLAYIRAITFNRWQRYASKLSNLDWRSSILKPGMQKYEMLNKRYQTKLQNFNMKVFPSLAPPKPPKRKRKGGRINRMNRYKKQLRQIQFACFIQKQCPDQVVDFASCMASNENTASYCLEEKRQLWICHAYSQTVSLNFLPISHSIWASGFFQIFHLQKKTSILEDYFTNNPNMKQSISNIININSK